MTDPGIHAVDKAVVSAKMLGSLDPSSIWALMCMLMLLYIWYTAKQATKFQDVRLQEALANAKLADAVSRLAEKVAQLQIITLQKQLGGQDVKPIQEAQG